MAAKRSAAVDGLKLAMALLVVAIHANPFADLGRVANLLTGEGLYRLAVPVFLVFNGYYLHPALQRGTGWATVRRASWLYALWMLLYLPVYWPLASGFTGPELLRFLLFGYWHLWYLAGLAMAAALLVLLRDLSNRGLLILALLTWAGGVAVSWGQAADLIHPPQPFRDPLLPNRNPLFLCLPYLAFGLLLARLRLPQRLTSGQAALLATLGTAGLLAESLLIAQLPVGIGHDTLAFLGLAAPALALWALTRPANAEGRLMSDLSSGLYFLHVGFVALLFRHTEIERPWVWALATAGSIALTLALRRLNLARHLF